MAFDTGLTSELAAIVLDRITGGANRACN